MDGISRALVSQEGIIKDLVSAGGVLNRSSHLFECAPEVLISDIKHLAANYESSKAALCQRLAVAFERHKAGELGTGMWLAWCNRFVLKPNSKPYGHSTIKIMVSIGLKYDVEAAYFAHKKHLKDMRDANYAAHKETTSVIRSRIIKEVNEKDAVKRLLGPLLFKRLSTARGYASPYQQQMEILVGAWENASLEVQRDFLHANNLRCI